MNSGECLCPRWGVYSRAMVFLAGPAEEQGCVLAVHSWYIRLPGVWDIEANGGGPWERTIALGSRWR